MPEDNIKVAVRVRPFNDREKARNASLVIEMQGKNTYIRDPQNMKLEPKPFAFDYSYWSHDGFRERPDGYLEPTGSRYADQNQVFNDLGKGVLDNAWKGYNCSLFAYGQTGSGKSYSMVGYGANKGIVPVVCEELFKEIETKRNGGIEYQVTLSMLEIYCEKVRDLLDPKPPKGGLKVREHPKRGFYVQGLITAPVANFKAIEAKIDEGTKNRTVAATNMNATSSRAHTIVQINFIQKNHGENTTKTSLINLVDLAGSERHSETGSEGERLKEGIVINQSLSSLGRVIKALADIQKGNKGVQVPYRDSILTSLLKNALGGNSKTIMIAALSPADINYEETLSTLRFADRTKAIKTQAIVNESATDRMIRELREENLRLQQMLSGSGGRPNNEEVEQLRQQLDQNKKLMEQMEQSWQQRLKDEANKAKQDSEDKTQLDARRKTTPHFWNLNEDPALTNIVVHFVAQGESTIGNNRAQPPATIQLNGLSIQEQHAKLRNDDNKHVFLTPVPGARVLVNGEVVTSSRELFYNDRVLFGGNHLYVFCHPADEKRYKKSKQKVQQVTYDMAQQEIAASSGIMEGLGGGSSAKSKEDMILEEDLIKLLPQVYQANAISDELKKLARFELVLIAPQARGLRHGHTEIFVKMLDRRTDCEFLWDKNKFINRFYGMQEMYQNYADGNKNWDLPKDRDPFQEPSDTEVMIGIVYAYLQSLAYMVEVDEQLPINDCRGNERGQLKVLLVPCSEDGREIIGEYVDSPEELVAKPLNFKVKILNAIGLPRKFLSSRCKYKFYMEEREAVGPEAGGTNPTYNFEKTFKFKPVTKQLIEYLRDQALIIEIWGKQSDKPIKKVMPLSQASVTSNEAANFRTKSELLEAKLSKIQRLIDDAITTESKDSLLAVQKALKEEQQMNGFADTNGNYGWPDSQDDRINSSNKKTGSSSSSKKKKTEKDGTKSSSSSSKHKSRNSESKSAEKLPSPTNENDPKQPNPSPPKSAETKTTSPEKKHSSSEHRSSKKKSSSSGERKKTSRSKSTSKDQPQGQ